MADSPLLGWSDVSVSLNDGSVLLTSNSGQLQTGELLCVMGPSGAGKTTLLSAVFGDKRLSQGEVRLHGETLFSAALPLSPSRSKGAIGYVRQRDIMIEVLTVAETLRFTAQLFMPNASSAEVDSRVLTVAKDMGLEHTLKTTIGSTMRRGVSGGELKRVNIAEQLLTTPQVLLLDEPTSGLDSTYALTVVRHLRESARKRSIGMLCTLHQPSSQIVGLLDRIMLMGPDGGRIVYDGAASTLGSHLTNLGLSVPSGLTLTDHAMQLLCDDAHLASLAAAWDAPGKHRTAMAAAVAAADGSGSRSKEEENGEEIAPTPSAATAAATITTTSVAVKGGSSTGTVVIAVADGAAEQRPGAAAAPKLSFIRAVWLLARRQRKQSRGFMLKRDEVVLNVMTGLITGTIWWDAAGTTEVHGAYFFILTHMTWWPGFLYLFAFPPEVAVLTKELLSGAYSIEAYCVAKILADTPSEMIQPSIFFAICLPMIGVPPLAAVLIWLACLLHYQTSSTIGMICSVLTSQPRCPVGANTAISCWNILQMCGGGYLRDPATFHVGLRWIPYVSVFYYSSSVLSQVAAPDGAADPRYSMLGIGTNIAILGSVVVGLKVLLYLSLKTRELKFV